jgi:hypothetical protein
LEGAYRSNWRQWANLTDIHLSVFVDFKDAEKVEMAWRGMVGIPKLILQLTYMKRIPGHVICRQAAIKPWDLVEHLSIAKRIIENRLDSAPEKVYFCKNLNRETERISRIVADLSRQKESLSMGAASYPSPSICAGEPST